MGRMAKPSGVRGWQGVLVQAVILGLLACGNDSSPRTPPATPDPSANDTAAEPDAGAPEATPQTDESGSEGPPLISGFNPLPLPPVNGGCTPGRRSPACVISCVWASRVARRMAAHSAPARVTPRLPRGAASWARPVRPTATARAGSACAPTAMSMPVPEVPPAGTARSVAATPLAKSVRRMIQSRVAWVWARAGAPTASAPACRKTPSRGRPSA
jgi:hypothetical protein